MGRFRFVVEGEGQHSPPPAQDEAGDADAIAKLAVSQLQAAGVNVSAAVFEHWPGEPQYIAESLVPEGEPDASEPQAAMPMS